jgi:hypothetical protein
MRSINRRLRRLKDIIAPQGEEGPSITEILRAARWPGIAGGQSLQVAPSKTVASAQPRTMAEIVRYRRQIRLAQEAVLECSPALRKMGSVAEMTARREPAGEEGD